MNIHRTKMERTHLGGQAERIATTRALEEALESAACRACGGSGMTYPNGPAALVFDICTACGGAGRVTATEGKA